MLTAGDLFTLAMVFFVIAAFFAGRLDGKQASAQAAIMPVAPKWWHDCLIDARAKREKEKS